MEVSERTPLDKVTVSRAVIKLITSGRVDRRIAGSPIPIAGDRYSTCRTRAGGLLGEIAPMVLDFEDRLLDDLSGLELKVFNRVIDKLFVKSHWMGDQLA